VYPDGHYGLCGGAAGYPDSVNLLGGAVYAPLGEDWRLLPGRTTFVGQTYPFTKASFVKTGPGEYELNTERLSLKLIGPEFVESEDGSLGEFALKEYEDGQVSDPTSSLIKLTICRCQFFRSLLRKRSRISCLR
jgi:hypothetical protein